MKKIIYLAIVLATVSSCAIDNHDLLSDYHAAFNKNEKTKMRKILADNFLFIDEFGREMDKTMYLNQIDSLNKQGVKVDVLPEEGENLNITGDSVIIIFEKVTSIVDSIANITPNIVYKKTYKFENGKIKSISVDSTLNQVEYTNSFNEKILPFYYYLKNKHNIKNENEINQYIDKHWAEFQNNSDRNSVIVIGSWISTSIEKALWGRIVLHNNNSATIYFSDWNLPTNTTYHVEGNTVQIFESEYRINIPFKIVNGNTLQGPAGGYYKRID